MLSGECAPDFGTRDAATEPIEVLVLKPGTLFSQQGRLSTENPAKLLRLIIQDQKPTILVFSALAMPPPDPSSCERNGRIVLPVDQTKRIPK